MSDLARTLAVLAIVVSALIPLIGWIRGYDLHQMLLTWLSLTFLMIPGQPPIIITMALALASLELARSQVIVRQLKGAETLGSVTTILSDKTGTMTENRMVLRRIILGDGSIFAAEHSAPDEILLLRNFLTKALAAIPDSTNDPTDQAMLNAAQKTGILRNGSVGRLIHQVGFTTGKYYRSMEYRTEVEHQLFVTGSPEFIIAHCTRYDAGGRINDWEDDQRNLVWANIEQLAFEGQRITAYAYRASPAENTTPEELVLLGCAVLNYPIRPGVKDAIAELTKAGVRTVMVTGDNPATAAFVAQSVGLDASIVVTGPELNSLSEHELIEALKRVQVFARTSPEHKLQLVAALQSNLQVVAVTGDGINDAPALRAANIGVAMGIKGTDVAKEAADLVLTDDDFAHLPMAVAVGRKAYDNFRKGIIYYLSAKAILLTIFVIPLLVGLPFPFSPIQIIATELLMDLASSTIFVGEAAEPDIMRRKPRPRTRFLSQETGLLILRNMVGLVTAVLVSYFASIYLGYGEISARTAAFATWLLGHVMLALIVKQTHTPLIRQGLLTNRFGAGWLLGMVALVLTMTLIPGFQDTLNTTMLNGVQWVMVIAGAILASAWIEVRKLVAR